MILNRDKKLLYLKIFYPTWKILRSEEPWTSEFGLGQHVLKHLVWLAQFSKTKAIAILQHMEAGNKFSVQ